MFVLLAARLRGVHDGLFTGQIDAVDTSAATYRVTFDRNGLGTHTVPDYEVLVRLILPTYLFIHLFIFDNLSTNTLPFFRAMNLMRRCPYLPLLRNSGRLVSRIF